ncbi:MAG: phage tail length tape measure family protein [Pseudomonadota bacterium]
MSQFNVSMLLTADASQARRELQGAGADLQQFGDKARQAGATASAGLRQAEAQIVKLRQANAAVTGNLVAQFNDVGQMLASGQSPLLLAVQQGTQISQALGPLGARGAVAALGQAFVGMLNPVNLAVFAAVAGLGLLGNALRNLVGEPRLRRQPAAGAADPGRVRIGGEVPDEAHAPRRRPSDRGLRRRPHPGVDAAARRFHPPAPGRRGQDAGAERRHAEPRAIAEPVV